MKKGLNNKKPSKPRPPSSTTITIDAAFSDDEVKPTAPAKVNTKAAALKSVNKNVQFPTQAEQSVQDMAVPPKRKIVTDINVLKEKLRDIRDRFGDVSESLKCGVCGNIFLDPVQIVHVDCNHIYCERCLETRTVDESMCPECGFQFNPKMVKKATNIQNIILDQLVPCFYEPAGCMERIRFRELEDHEMRCACNPDRLVECICGQEMNASKHPSHLGKDCPEFSFDCPHGCGEKLQKHEDFDCIMKPVRCDFAKFGCTFKGPRADLYKHNKDQFQSHMGLMASRIQDLESETKQMHIDQREQQRKLYHEQQLNEVRRSVGGGFQQSMEKLVPELADEGRAEIFSGPGGSRKGPTYSLANAKMKMAPTGTDQTAFGSDRVLPAGLTKVNDLVRPKWNRFSQPKKVIESPKDGTYRFVRPFSCAFVGNETLVMTDVKTCWLIDVETGSVRNTLDPLSKKERQLYRPRGVAVQESQLRIFVSDSMSDAIHSFTPGGEYSSTFGKEKLKYPLGITTWRNKVYVCDSHHNTVQMFDSAGTHIGNLTEDYHGSPMQCASSENTGNIYITMNSLSDAYVLVVDSMGEFITTFGTKGDQAGSLNDARGVVVDHHENVLVTNSNQFKLQMFCRVPTKLSVRESRRWENRVREQIWLEEMEKHSPQWDDGTGGAKGGSVAKTGHTDSGDHELSFEQKVEERLRKRPTEMKLPKFEYRVVDWLGDGDSHGNYQLGAPNGCAISPNRQMLAVVDEIKNKIYIY